MIITINNVKNADKIEKYLKSLNVNYQIYNETFGIVIDTGNSHNYLDTKIISSLDGVLSVVDNRKSHYLWSRNEHSDNTTIKVGNHLIGNNNITFIAGPCSVESLEQLNDISSKIKDHGCHILRAGTYKPRTSPYDFQGLEEEGLEILQQCKEKYHMPIISEITNINQLDLFLKYVDIIQVGARSMQNYELLKTLGKINKPILLKRGMGNTIEELLLSAEYILKGGNNQVILCERGIRTFETSTRYTLDLSAVPVLKKLTHLPIFVDPSHAMGNWEYVESMTLAAIAAGADGIMVEVHNAPLHAKSDGLQSLNIEHFYSLIEKSKKIADAIGKECL